jgi:hypothetical protein
MVAAGALLAHIAVQAALAAQHKAAKELIYICVSMQWLPVLAVGCT